MESYLAAGDMIASSVLLDVGIASGALLGEADDPICGVEICCLDFHELLYQLARNQVVNFSASEAELMAVETLDSRLIGK